MTKIEMATRIEILEARAVWRDAHIRVMRRDIYRQARALKALKAVMGIEP